jgi:hypothetical protein
MKLKQWDRFAHSGVLRDLDQLRRTIEHEVLYEFGSSGDGEITIRALDRSITAYARKFRARDGWRPAIYRGGRKLEPADLDTLDAVVQGIRRFQQ